MTNFKDIPFGEIEKFSVLIEIPEGSQNKYEYDEKLQAMVLDFVFRDGFHFPFNYGCIAGTLGGDGDPLDAIVLSSHQIAMGTVAPCRAFAMIETLDRGEQDSKILCVPITDPLAEKYRDFSDLTEEEIRGFEDFYHELAIQKNKIIEIKGFHNKTRAEEEIKKSLIKK